MDETIDPKTLRTRTKDRSPSSGDGAYLEILFHPNLARIGERCAVPKTPLVIGRDAPLFHADTARESPRALVDPCISRRALTIGWNAAAKLFSVTAMPESKRPIHLFTENAAPLSGGARDVPPGTLVAIGDRVLLLLAMGSAEDARDGGRAMVGGSPAMARLRSEVRALASARDSVLVYGQTGVGKDLVARALHDEGARRGGPFVAVNCAALPENLVESELFGHARGAFSGAAAASAGLFRSAAGGTLFLDEVGELPLPIQAKLLRVLQNGTVRPLGETNEIPVDVRVVVATNRDLAREAEEGRFRADLYARLEAPRIDVPPLRARKSDIPLLFVTFLAARRNDSVAREDDALARLWREADAHSPPLKMAFFLDLLRYDWPRNVRELEKRAAAIAHATREAGELRIPALAETEPPRPPPPERAQPERAQAERAQPDDAQREERRGGPRARPDLEELLRLLDAHDYVQNRLAAALGISRTTLDKWMRALGVRRPKDVPDSEIEEARAAARGNITEMAQILRVSIRGLKLRLKEMSGGDA